jgi:hypothetical protein
MLAAGRFSHQKSWLSLELLTRLKMMPAYVHLQAVMVCDIGNGIVKDE